MATEQRVVELVIDASGAVAGTRIGAAAYDHFGARAEAAMARAQAAADRQFTVFQNKVPKSVDAVTAAYDNLRAKMDPVFYAQLRAEREMTQSLAVVNRAVLLGVTTQAEATRDIIRLKQMQIDAINRVRDAQLLADRATMAGNDNFPMGGDARYRRQNLSYQYFDIGQSAALGMPAGMIIMQQVPQILQLYAGQGGFNAALKDTQALLGGVARYLGPVAVGAVAVYGAWKLLASYSVDAAFKVSEATKELASQASSWQSVEGQVSQLADVQKSYNDLIVETARVHSDATTTIIANSEREFRAKKALMEVELLRQQASIEVQRAEIGLAQNQLRADVATSTASRDDRERMGVYDPRIGQFAPMPQTMGQVDPIDRLTELLEKNPLTTKIKEMQATLDLSTLSAEKLAKALGTVFDPTAGGVIDENGKLNEFVPLNPAIPARNPRRSLMDDPAFAMSASRLRDLKQEIELFGLSAGAAAKKRFEMEALNEATEQGIQLSEEERVSLKKSAEAYGELTDKLSRMRLVQDAQFEVDQMLRSDREANIAAQLRSYNMPVDLESQDAALLRSIEIAKEYGETWREVGDIGRSAIDQITDGMADGFKDFDDMAKSILGDINKEFLKLAIANPLKNAIFGDTNTTLDNIGGAKGFFSALTGGKMPLDPALRNVASMQVTAATVVVNGGVSGFSPVDGVTRMHAPANGNDPFAAILRPAGGDMAAYAQAIKDIESSGGNYSALGPITKSGDRAYGAYQVMGNNIGPWTEAALGRRLTPAEFLASQSAQDSVFNHRFGGYVDKYGPQGAAQAWFGGPGSVGGSGRGADILGTTGNAYVEKFNASLGKMTSSTDMAAQGLGNLGNGMGQFGNALSQVGTGKGSGGLFDNLLGGLGSIFGGISPTSSFWAPNTTYSNWLMGRPGFARGTNGAPEGWNWVGEDGPELMRMRGGEVIRPHAQSRDMAANAGRQSVKREFNIINPPPGYQADVEEGEDDYGNEKVNVTFSKAISREMGRTGSPANKTLRSMGARKPRRKL